jgi:hypothetical protein
VESRIATSGSLITPARGSVRSDLAEQTAAFNAAIGSVGVYLTLITVVNSLVVPSPNTTSFTIVWVPGRSGLVRYS